MTNLLSTYIHIPNYLYNNTSTPFNRTCCHMER